MLKPINHGDEESSAYTFTSPKITEQQQIQRLGTDPAAYNATKERLASQLLPPNVIPFRHAITLDQEIESLERRIVAMEAMITEHARPGIDAFTTGMTRIALKWNEQHTQLCAERDARLKEAN